MQPAGSSHVTLCKAQCCGQTPGQPCRGPKCCIRRGRRGTGWGGQVAWLLQGRQSQEYIWADGSETVQEVQAGYLQWRSQTPPLPSAGSSATPKELRSGVTNRDRVGRGSGTRQVTQGLSWGLPSAQDQHSCITGDGGDGTVQRCSGAGCGADSGQCRRVGPTVSCPWPAAKPAPCPQKSLHFRVAENLHPPFQKVTLR